VWKSDNHGDSWTPISGDLTRNENRVRQPIMGRTWSYDAPRDLWAMSQFNTITSLSESPLVEGLVYVGTDDGLIQITEDGGENWKTIDSLPGVPKRFFVNDIKADLHDADTVYVVVDDHKSGDFAPYILKSENRGRSWKSISGNLPERHVLWRVVQDHVKPGLMFVGTEFGVFFTVNGGGTWTKLKGGAPNISFRDLVIQTRENDLVGATFGRSFYILDDYTPLRDVTEDMLKSGGVLFPVRKADWYVPKRPLGCDEPTCKASQGDSFYTAPNPAFGATFTYYLAEEIMSSKDARREVEKEKEAKNEDVVAADWDTVIAESREDAPAIVFLISHPDGSIINQVVAPAKAGFNRVAWDLRYPSVEPWEPVPEGEEAHEGTGILVVPGSYSVSMHKRVDGVMTDLGQKQTFNVVSIRPDPVLAGSTQQQRVLFQAQVDELMRAAAGSSEAVDDFYNDLPIMSVQARLWHARFDPASNAHGPTTAQKESLRIARKLYDETVTELTQLVDVDYAALKEAMDIAKVPWTPGRGIQE
jgi:hypothetical protein